MGDPLPNKRPFTHWVLTDRGVLPQLVQPLPHSNGLQEMIGLVHVRGQLPFHDRRLCIQRCGGAGAPIEVRGRLEEGSCREKYSKERNKGRIGVYFGINFLSVSVPVVVFMKHGCELIKLPTCGECACHVHVTCVTCTHMTCTCMYMYMCVYMWIIKYV